MLGTLRMIWGIVASYRIWIMLAAAGGVLISVLVFYGNCRANAVALEAAQAEIVDLKTDYAASENARKYQNARIQKDNEQKLAALRRANQQLNEARAAAALLQVERDKAKLDLEEAQFALLEALKDDEDFADWANEPVPLDTWGLLRTASEGTGGSSLRTDH
jgi:hypothetical protein